MSESNFIQKVGAACNKKEDLYQKSKTRYAVRSIFAGGFLTLSTAVGAVAADLLNTSYLDLVVFYFHSSLPGAWFTSYS